MAYYPMVLITNDVAVWPVLGVLAGDPYVFDFASQTSYQTTKYGAFQQAIFERISRSGATWAIGRYLENRTGLLAAYPQMIESKRVFHAGLDVIAPPDTPVYAPVGGVVDEVGFDEGLGNYGGFVRLRHDLEGACFYSFYGHLRRPHIIQAGDSVEAGAMIGALGVRSDSGGWFSHLHLQILTRRAVDQGRTLEGYVDIATLAEMDLLFPSPYPLFRVA